jgi:hypothetical protein
MNQTTAHYINRTSELKQEKAALVARVRELEAHTLKLGGVIVELHGSLQAAERHAQNLAEALCRATRPDCCPDCGGTVDSDGDCFDCLAVEILAEVAQ